MKFCPQCGNELQSIEVDGKSRLACVDKQCGYVYWNNPVPVVAALINYDGSYLIARNARWPEGIYSVITGYLEENETPEQAVVREVQEELGLTARSNQFIGHYSFFKKNQLILCYEVVAAGELVLNHELTDVKRLSREELMAYDFSPLYITQQIIRDWLAKND